MKKKEYYRGKYYLREGDLKPEVIDGYVYNKYKKRFFEYLENKGLLFNNRKDAEIASDSCLIIVRGVRNHTMMREEDIQGVE